MQIPYVAIYITPNDGLGFSHVTSASGQPLDVETPLNFFDGKGYEETVKYLGQVVLGLMASMYPKEMEGHPELKVPYDSRADLDTISHLISKSLKWKTTEFIPTINALIDEVSTGDPLMRANITIAGWPDVRAMLERNSA